MDRTIHHHQHVSSPHGAIMIQDDEGKISKLNGHHLKVFLMPSDLNEMVDIIKLVDFENIHLLDKNFIFPSL
jgi:hypothetical protein